MYGYENCTIKKAEHQRIDAFELWCWRQLLRFPWTARRSNQSIVKEISPEYSRLMSFRTDWFDPLAVQGTLKSLFQHHSSKTSISGVQPLWSNSHMAWLLEKIILLTTQTTVGKVMSLLFNMLSRLVTAFLPRNKCLLISWLQSPSVVILEPKKLKSLTVSPSICHEVMGPDAMILVFWMLSFKPAFSLSSFTFIKRLFSSSSLSP